MIKICVTIKYFSKSKASDWLKKSNDVAAVVNYLVRNKDLGKNYRIVST